MDFYEIAFDTMGVFPKGTIRSDGTKEKRTKWQEGWNAFSKAYLDKVIKIEEKFSEIPEETKDMIEELLDAEELSVRYNKELTFYTNMSDTFVYACAEGEDVSLDKIEEFYKIVKSKKYGSIIWASIQRNEKLLVEVVEWIKAADEWTDKLERLPDNKCNKIEPRW